MLKRSFQEGLERVRQDPIGLEDYLTLLRFPSISSEPQHRQDLKDCAEWLAARMKQIGLQVDVEEPETAPILIATYQKDPALPTLLLYNHYDVQPVDPLSAWHHPPFEPSIHQGVITARGAQDNKGQLAYVLSAIRLLLEDQGSLPCNLKWIVEGEEEHGSAVLAAALPRLASRLTADDCLIVDGGMGSLDRPSVELGARGIATFTLKVRGSLHDLHSGQMGGLAYNPLRALVELLGKVWDEDGHVTIPGFYDGVTEWSPEQQKLLDSIDEADLTKLHQCDLTGGEQKLSAHVRNWLRPTFEINGISGGYGGEGFKTVIPAEAMAKVSCRIVPHQDPVKMASLIAAYFQSHAPKGVELSVEPGHGGDAFCGEVEGPLTRASCLAMEEILQKPCLLALTGGSLPLCGALAKAAGAGILCVGMGLPGDHIHAPNEQFSIDRYERGVLLIQNILMQYAALKRA